MRLPVELEGARWLTSPLRRAVQTARLLHGHAEIEPRLIETDWGAFEGLQSVITHRHAARISARGQAGLDFRPPGGEAPRDLRDRLIGLFAELHARGGLYVGVTHKGVIRAALSLALGWSMLDKPPVRLAWRAAHLFDVSPTSGVTLVQANLMLEARLR